VGVPKALSQELARLGGEPAATLDSLRVAEARAPGGERGAVHVEGLLDDVEEVIFDVLKLWDPKEILCSWKLNRAIGEYLTQHAEGRGILKSAYAKKVPVFVPAFTDSELGLDVALGNRIRMRDGQPKLRFDPFEDLEHFADTLLAQKKLGIFTIGGGVPRNWAQQFGPYVDLRNRDAVLKCASVPTDNRSETCLIA